MISIYFRGYFPIKYTNANKSLNTLCVIYTFEPLSPPIGKSDQKCREILNFVQNSFCSNVPSHITCSMLKVIQRFRILKQAMVPVLKSDKYTKINTESTYTNITLSNCNLHDSWDCPIHKRSEQFPRSHHNALLSLADSDRPIKLRPIIYPLRHG